jgi:hypothetical protein
VVEPRLNDVHCTSCRSKFFWSTIVENTEK